MPLRAEEADDQYRATIRPLMDRHCVSCHGSENPAEGLNLAGEKSRELIAPLRGVQTLDKLADRLRSQTMPPPDAGPPLLAADCKTLIAWIDQQIDRSLGGKSNPGRVTIRRLTRLDYRNPHAPPAAENRRTSLELHTLKPLLGAGTAGAGQASVGPAARQRQPQQAYRYPLTVPLDEPVYLSFLRGMIGPHAYSDDLLKPIEPVAESDESRVVPVATSSHSWTGSLAGPANIRPGSLVAFDFDVRLVAKPRDSVTAFLATPGGTNSSMFANAGSYSVEGQGTHRLTQVGRRKPTTHDAWNNRLTLVITTRTQTAVGQVSPLHVIRPFLPKIAVDTRRS